MEREMVVLWQVTKFKRQLESTRHESQDRGAEAMEMWAVELLAVERATAAERGLDVAKVHQA